MTANNPTHCPHCGQPIPQGDFVPPAGETEPGIIHDLDAGEGRPFSLIQITDLTGDPFHDWPLIVARFQYTLPWLVEVILSDPKTARFLKGHEVAEPPPVQAGPSQLWLPPAIVLPHLPKIIQNGQFTYGHQSRIAEALGVPNQGSYRTRIQNVASAL